MLVKQKAVRVLLINEANKFLFLRMLPPKNNVDVMRKEPYWLSPGGRLEGDESIEQAAIRELFEETGLKEEEITLGPAVFHGKITLNIKGQETEISQRMIVGKSFGSSISLENLMPDEKEIIKTYKWFSIEEIKNSKEPIYPLGIETYLPSILEGNFPEESIEIPFMTQR